MIGLDFFYRRTKQLPQVDFKTPKQLQAERRQEVRRLLSHLSADEIITLVSFHFHERSDVNALRDLSRTADRAADALERS